MQVDFAGIATVITGLVTSIVAIAISIDTMRRTTALQIQLTNKTVELQERLQRDETIDAKRRFVIDLWDRIGGISDINPQVPIGPDVRKALNALELIAMCWEGNIVDKEMVERIFGKMYRGFYNSISPPDTFISAYLCRGISPIKIAKSPRL